MARRSKASIIGGRAWRLLYRKYGINLIQAVKIYRQRTGLELRDAIASLTRSLR